MANTKNITFDQLQLALERVKLFTENTYSHLDHIHSTVDITELKNYKMSTEGSAIGETMHLPLTVDDSLNEALGKLDKSIYNIVENIGSINIKDHNHNDIYYTMGQIDEFIGAIRDEADSNLKDANDYTDDQIAQAIDDLIADAPDVLDTLKEIADSLNNDPNLYQTMVDGLARKVAGPDTSSDNHVMIFDGTSGKVAKDSGFTMGCSVPEDAIFTDHNVRTQQAPTDILYITGTTSTNMTDGTLGINIGMYIDGNDGRLVSPIFEGDLVGKADDATMADTARKTQAALNIKLNGEDAGTFDGSTAVNIDVTPDAIGAHDKAYTEKASDTEVETMVAALFGTYI